jgi:hypothetical protein
VTTEKERIRGKWWLLCRWEGDTAKQQARAIRVRKAAKVLALDVSCPPPIQLEGSACQFFGLKPNNRPSFGDCCNFGWTDFGGHSSRPYILGVSLSKHARINFIIIDYCCIGQNYL